jgi:hypothetical protein
MLTWKKLTLWVAGTLIVIVVGCAALLDHLFDDMCATTVIDQFASPSNKLKAVLFQIDCGATTGFNTQVSIVPGSTVAMQKNSLPKSFFAAGGYHGQAPSGESGAPEVRVFWKSDDRLEIQHHAVNRIIRAEKYSSGVAIEYTTFRTPATPEGHVGKSAPRP